MTGLDMATGAWGQPVWAAGAAAAVVVVLAALALRRAGLAEIATAASRAAVVLTGIWGVWIVIDRADAIDRAAGRRAFDQRHAELALRAMAPGSPLGCLGALAGDAVETACEKSLFADPETIAAAVEYMAARLVLLADGAVLARRGETGVEPALAGLRLGLETDRFGFAAHVLAVRDSCTPLNCDGLALFNDASRVQANLKDRVFEGYVGRYAADWRKGSPKPGAPVADNAPALAGTTTAEAPPAVPLNPKYDFPSAASIPPVSIMTPEPTAPAAAAAASPPPKPAPTASVRRPPPQRPAARTAAPPEPPVPIGPPPSAASAGGPGAALR